MENKSNARDMLDKFVRQYGAPKLLKFDGSKEQSIESKCIYSNNSIVSSS